MECVVSFKKATTAVRLEKKSLRREVRENSKKVKVEHEKVKEKGKSCQLDQKDF